MANRSKTLQLCSYYMGTPLYQNLFDELTALGFDHDIVYYAATNAMKPPENRHNLISSHAYRPGERLFFKTRHRKVYDDLLVKLNLEDYNLSHAHSLVSNGYLAYRLKQEFGIPYIVAVRNADIYTIFRYLRHLIPVGRKVMMEAERVVFLSPAYRQQVISRYVPVHARDEVWRRSVVIPNGIDRFYFDHPPAKTARSEVLRLAYVGRIDDPNKNVRTIIKACDLLVAAGRKLELTLAGRLRGRWPGLTFPRRDYLRMVGPQPKEGVRQVLDEADIFVMPSKHETFGLVYAEALSQATPVIYTRGQGFDGHLPDGEVGYSVAYNDPIELARNIELIAQNWETLSANALAASQRFAWSKIALRYAEIYRSCRLSR